MAYVELIPTIAAASSGWNYPSLALGNDDAYAILNANSTATLWLRAANPNLPSDIDITGVEIIYSALTSGSVSGAALSFNYFTANTLTNVATSIAGTDLTNTEASGSVGGSSNTFGYLLRRPDVHNNNYFGISITPVVGVATPILIDDVKIRIHYTAASYLVGSRSVFSTRQGSQFDVQMANGIPNDTTSLIQRKYNSITPESQVRSEDVNLLGDALYQIETAILSNPNAVRSVGGAKMYAFSVTITGNVAATGSLIYAKIKLDGSEYNNIINLGSIKRSKVPNVPRRIDCHWTSAMGWVVTAASGNQPVYAQSHGMYFERNTDGTVDLWISVDVIGKGIYHTKDDYDLYEATPGTTYQGYIGCNYVPARVPAGALYLKILALGREA